MLSRTVNTVIVLAIALTRSDRNSTDKGGGLAGIATLYYWKVEGIELA